VSVPEIGARSTYRVSLFLRPAGPRLKAEALALHKMACYWVEGKARGIDASAYHELGESTEAQTDATLAAQLFEKCAMTSYATRQGAECKPRYTDVYAPGTVAYEFILEL
jgi:hypothetical protein